MLQNSTLSTLSDILGDSLGVKHVSDLLELLDHYGVSDWVQFDASVVRGLAYYTGVVFEAFDRKGQFRAICGGGRYDGILKIFGANEPVASAPAVGFGFGDGVIMELLAEKDLLPDFHAESEVDVVLCAPDRTSNIHACRLAKDLRKAGLSVDCLLSERFDDKRAFRRAKQRGARCLVCLRLSSGPEAAHDIPPVAQITFTTGDSASWTPRHCVSEIESVTRLLLTKFTKTIAVVLN